ncbi:MAG TPA: DoxX family protein [Terriglobales bacterium]|nr:DoxX family protein [Terriglobales bacterium]
MKAPFLIGRAILGGFFVYNGINHFRQAEGMAQYAQAKKIPAPKAGVIATGVAMLVGGASLITGIKPKWGAAAVIGFLGAASPTMHDFWNAEDPQQKQNDMINFSKNLALAGAALALAGVDEPWEASVPVLQPNRIEQTRKFGRRAKKFGEWLAA